MIVEVSSGETPEEVRAFLDSQWPSANLEVFGWADQSRWKPREFLITAREAGELAGVATVRILGGRGHLGQLLIRRDLRGQGVGARLLEEYEALCRQHSCHKLVLETYKDSRSERFYVRHGYEREAVFERDLHGIDWVRLMKFLDSRDE